MKDKRNLLTSLRKQVILAVASKFGRILVNPNSHQQVKLFVLFDTNEAPLGLSFSFLIAKQTIAQSFGVP